MNRLRALAGSWPVFLSQTTAGLALALALTLTAGARSTHAAPASKQGPGTQYMVRTLERIARSANPLANRYLNQERVPRLKKMLLLNPGNPRRQAQIQDALVKDLLNAGMSEEALQELDKLAVMMKAQGLYEQNRRIFQKTQAICHLRIGEQENCLNNHTTDSCLMPIRGGGIHKLQRGSRAALDVLTNILTEFPDDLEARWLLNIAYMTLGLYPTNVPSQWLIPATVFESDHDINRFYDVAGPLGLDVNELSGGCIVDDFDRDGFLDVMASSFGLDDQLRFFRNDGNGSFTDQTIAAGLRGEVGGLNLLQTDYNNDGFPDVLILRGAWFLEEGRHPNSLLRNNGDGTFEDVTQQAGLLSFHPTQTAAWLDYNNDGWIDLFVGNESFKKSVHRCELFRNNGDGTFTECAEKSGLGITGFVKGVTAGDINNDGRIDLYLSLLGGTNFLFRNDGPAGVTGSWKFTDIAATAGVEGPIHSFPTWFWDYDNDGWLDLFLAGYKIKNVGDVAADYLGLPHNGQTGRLYRNNRDGTFSDVSKRCGLDKILHAMGSNYGDLDNDGYLDFYIGTGEPNLKTLEPNRMFRNAAGKTFQDVTTSGGFGHLQKGHGVAFADVNNDGTQDIYTVMGGAYSGDIYRNVLFKNPGHGNRWITLELEGAKSNRAAIGARIKVTVVAPQGQRIIYKTVCSGGSFGASPLRQEIGLGRAQAIRSVEVFWPATGKTQTVQNLEMNHFYRIREQDPNPTLLERTSFELPADGAAGHHHHHHQ